MSFVHTPSEVLADKVAAACDEFKDYLSELEHKYLARDTMRRAANIRVLNFVGHGRAGKDEAAQIYAARLGIKYSGATSLIINPLIAWSLGLEERRSYETRHDNRMFWFDWCCEFRKNDPARLTRMLLADGDVSVGTRSKSEFQTGLDEGVVQTAVWVHNVRTGVDPTMEFDAGYVVAMPKSRWDWLDNNGDLDNLRTSVDQLARRQN